MKTRIYKYALHPSSMQRKALEKCGKTSRFLWNRLVSETQFALREMQNGRRATIENIYKSLYANKELVGMRAKAIADLSKEKQISREKALKEFVIQNTTRDIKIPTRKKDGTRCIRWGNNHLAWKYAVEKVNSERDILISSNMMNIWTGIQAKWIDFGNSWDKGIFKFPNYKKYGEISSIQKQIGKSSKWSFGNSVDLSWCGSECLNNVNLNIHRSLPNASKIMQIAVVKETNNEWFLCVFLTAEDKVFMRIFNECNGLTVGIDPGVKSAMTTSDGKVIEPTSLSKQTKKENKLHRLSRQLARQTQAGNPNCFNEDGTWKKGHRITFRSKGMLKTAFQISRIKKYFRDAKTNYYHQAAIDLLNNYDNIGIGNVKLHNLVKGHGMLKRSINTRIREHAISDFKTKLKDKASLSLTPKGVYAINEAYTTQLCNVCGDLNGPKNDLSIRTWTCNKCHSSHERDINSAINIKNLTISEMKAAGSQSVSGVKTPKVHRLTKVIKTRSMETIKSQDDGLKQETFASAQVKVQTSTSVRTLVQPVTEHDMKVLSSADSTLPSVMMGHSQGQTCITDTEQHEDVGIQ